MRQQALTAWPIVLFMGACGGAPTAGPSPVAPPVAMAAGPARATIALPAGLDPDYVRALVPMDATGTPKHWAGGPFHHCFAPDVDRGVLEVVANRMTALSGVTRTEAGPCNVEWVVDSQSTDTKAISDLSGTATEIYRARVRFATDRASSGFGTAMHEGGHILGLGHSPRAEDLMVAAGGTIERDFTPAERAALAWVYGR